MTHMSMRQSNREEIFCDDKASCPSIELKSLQSFTVKREERDSHRITQAKLPTPSLAVTLSRRDVLLCTRNRIRLHIKSFDLKLKYKTVELYWVAGDGGPPPQRTKYSLAPRSTSRATITFKTSSSASANWNSDRSRILTEFIHVIVPCRHVVTFAKQIFVCHKK